MYSLTILSLSLLLRSYIYRLFKELNIKLLKSMTRIEKKTIYAVTHADSFGTKMAIE